MNRDELLAKITAVDFFVIDLALYLNTHPTDAEAIRMYNDYVGQAQTLRAEYEKQYGMLLANSSPSGTPWRWIDNPWPWQSKFNFSLTEERT